MVRHQNQGLTCFGAQFFSHEGTQGGGRGASQLGVVKKRGQRGFADGWPQIEQAGRVLTAAPGTGEHPSLGQPLLFEPVAHSPRLLPSGRAEGVRIYIGGESQVVPFEELSVVSAPYEVDGQVVGTLGVIGPTRMPYDRMIQIVDITSRLVSNALSHHK